MNLPPVFQQDGLEYFVVREWRLGDDGAQAEEAEQPTAVCLEPAVGAGEIS